MKPVPYCAKGRFAPRIDAFFVTNTQKGALLSFGSALGAAIFFIPFKLAGTLVARDIVVLATLLVAALLNTITSLRKLQPASVFDRVSMVTAAVFGVLTAIGNFGTSQALQYLGAGVTSVLQQTQILLVAAGSWVFLHERVSARFAVGTVVVLGGLVVMRAPSGAGSAIDLPGVSWALTSALCFGTMHVITRRVIQRIQPVPVNAMRLWVAVILLLLLPGNAAELVAMDPYPWLLCAVAAFAGPFLSRIAVMYAVRYISASHSVLITLVGPVFVFVFDYVFLGRAPTTLELVGGAVVLAGVSIPILELAGQRGPRPGQPGQPEP
jgi:drug/metabolite transporter (DMT)-like permease